MKETNPFNVWKLIWWKHWRVILFRTKSTCSPELLNYKILNKFIKRQLNPIKLFLVELLIAYHKKAGSVILTDWYILQSGPNLANDTFRVSLSFWHVDEKWNIKEGCLKNFEYLKLCF